MRLIISKNWRELPKDEKLNIPVKKFNIEEKEIVKIRKIQNSKKRLIEAAKIQYERFGDIHSYLTTWIAGYCSDVIIRQKFGSTKNLLKLFIKTPVLPKGINSSWKDFKRGTKIPEEITGEVAEETGVHTGDGNLYISTDKKGYKSYSYGISGDLTNEYIYHKEYLLKLIKKIYNIDLSISERREKNNIDSRCKSRALVEFKYKILKLPVGPKKKIKVPNQILKDKELQKKYIVGLIDTDFSITSSLAITGKLHSIHLGKQINKILKSNHIDHIYKKYSDHCRFYINKNSARRIIEDWGLKNEKHLSKCNLFKEFKEFIPYSTTPERLAVLNGKLGLEELKKVCENRK